MPGARPPGPNLDLVKARLLGPDSIEPSQLDADTAAKKKAVRDRIGADLVRADFEPAETDYWTYYSSSYGDWNGTDTSLSLSFFTGAPSLSTLVLFGDLTPKSITGVTHVRLRKRQRASSGYFGTDVVDVRQPAGKLYLRPYDASGPVATFTITNVTSVGSGNSAWWDLTGTMEQSADFNPGGAAFLHASDIEQGDFHFPHTQVQLDNGFLDRLRRLSNWTTDHISTLASYLSTNANSGASEPASLRHAMRDFLNSIFARLDSSNLTAKFKSDVQGPSEPYTVTTNQTRRAYSAVDSDNEWGLNNTPVIGGSSVGIAWRLDAANYPEILARWGTHKRIVFPSGVLRIEGGVNELGNRTLQATVVLTEGTLPAVDATSRPTLRGVPTWADVRDSVRTTGADDDHLVTEKAVADYAGTGDVSAEDTVPFAASFRDEFSRSFVNVVSSANGEAIVSTDNFTPIGTPDGTTAFVGLDFNNAAGTSEETALLEVKVGDWFRAKRGDKYIIAQILFINHNLIDSVREFWFNPSTAIDETLQYDTLGTGAGEIRFYRQRLSTRELLALAHDLFTADDRNKVLATKADNELEVDLRTLFDRSVTEAYTDIDFPTAVLAGTTTQLDTEAITMPLIDNNLVESEFISGFGTVYKFKVAPTTVRITSKVTPSKSVTIRLRKVSTKPVSTDDAKTLGTQVASASGTGVLTLQTTQTSISADEYFFIATAGGGTITFSFREITFDNASYSASLNVVGIETGGTSKQYLRRNVANTDVEFGEVAVTYQNSAPSNPVEGQLWWDADAASAGLPRKNGVHRRNLTEIQTTTAALPGVSLMTAEYTPSANNTRIFVKLRIVAGIQGDSDNDFAGMTLRVKRGTGNYKRMDEAADGYTKVYWRRQWQYVDAGATAYFDEFVLEPQNNTDTIKVNLGLYAQDGATVQNRTGFLNRFNGNNVRNAGPSYIEIYEMKDGGEMTYQTTTTLDAA